MKLFLIVEGAFKILWNQIKPIEPAVKPTAKKNANSVKSLGIEFTKKLNRVILPCAPQVYFKKI